MAATSVNRHHVPIHGTKWPSVSASETETSNSPMSSSWDRSNVRLIYGLFASGEWPQPVKDTMHRYMVQREEGSLLLIGNREM